MQQETNPFKVGKVLLIDKPLGWTSFQVVNKVRWLIKQKYRIKKIKVGHAGTLDPLATGLLIICAGKETKNIQTYMGLEKVYTGEMMLGATTPSYDLETEIDERYPIDHLAEELLKQTTEQFTGKIQQKPPVFSALKKDGKRLYEHAREGTEVDIPSREVMISEFHLTQVNIPKVQFYVRCAKGTYIRSLAHDFGKAVESGAHLTSLRREAIGDYHVARAQTIEDFEEYLRLL